MHYQTRDEITCRWPSSQTIFWFTSCLQSQYSSIQYCVPTFGIQSVIVDTVLRVARRKKSGQNVDLYTHHPAPSWLRMEICVIYKTSCNVFLLTRQEFSPIFHKQKNATDLIMDIIYAISKPEAIFTLSVGRSRVQDSSKFKQTFTSILNMYFSAWLDLCCMAKCHLSQGWCRWRLQVLNGMVFQQTGRLP